jgi:hypothetical protein
MTLVQRLGNTSNDLAVAAKVGLANYDGNSDFASPSIKNLRQGGTPEVKLDNSVLSKLPTHTRVTSAIALYMPPGVKVSYKIVMKQKQQNYQVI